MKNHIIPIFVPHLGCPNECVFCNQNKISGTQEFQFEEVYEEISKFLNIYSYTDDIELAFYGGSFTMIEDQLQDQLLEMAYKLKVSGKISKIRASTRPDGIDEQVINRLKKYEVDTIELGVQSMCQDVLDKSKRGHNTSSVYQASKLLKENNITLGLQQMVGLPGDSEEKSINTSKEIINIGPKFVRIYPTLVIKDTELADMYESGIYNDLDLESGVNTVSKLVVLYRLNNIEIIRIGLQSSDNLTYENDVLAGPLHHAFGELVETNILINIFKYSGIKVKNNSTIKSSGPIISQLVGQKSMGKKELLDYYNLNNINFKIDKNIKNEIFIDNNEIINLRDGYKTLEKEWINVFKEY